MLGDKQVSIDGEELSQGDVITLEVALSHFIQDIDNMLIAAKLGRDLQASYLRRATNILRLLEDGPPKRLPPKARGTKH